MSEHIPSWTNDYITRKWEAPFGCWFLVADVLTEQYGLEDLEDYSAGLSAQQDSVQRRALAIQAGLKDRTFEVDTPEPGDVVVIAAVTTPIHVGIVVADNWMLHCDSGINTVITRLDDIRYKNRIEGFYRPIK